MKTFIPSFLFLISLCLFSCKKGKDAQPENSIIGNWQEIDMHGLDRSVKFGKDNSFALVMGSSDGSSAMFTGTYQTKGDSLKVNTKEILEQQPGKPVKRTVSAYALYEKATFSVTGDTLTLKYLTYPADGPVPTVGKFRRMTAID